MVLLLIPALLLTLLNRLRAERLSLPASSWLFATLALWSALLRLPFMVSPPASGRGTGRLAGGAIAVPFSAPAAGLDHLGADCWACWASWRPLIRPARMPGNTEHRPRLPPPPSQARNVVLIVWDTVRASNLSLYGYPRDTTPNLTRWAQKGVRYDLAVAPAPWTYPSHSSFFTGQWPFKLNSQWKLHARCPSTRPWPNT